MVSGILIVLIVAVFLPMAAIMSGAIGAAILGWLLKEEADANHEGSELLELNR